MPNIRKPGYPPNAEGFSLVSSPSFRIADGWRDSTDRTNR